MKETVAAFHNAQKLSFFEVNLYLFLKIISVVVFLSIQKFIVKVQKIRKVFGRIFLLFLERMAVVCSTNLHFFLTRPRVIV